MLDRQHVLRIGNTYFGYRNENWLNISDDGSVTGINPNTGVRETPAQFIRDELSNRMAAARTAGFDSIEFDNVELYDNKTGFATTAAQNLAFNESIANLAHSLVVFSAVRKNGAASLYLPALSSSSAL